MKDDWREVVKDALKILLGIVFALFFLGLMASCKAKKDVVKSETDVSSFTQAVDTVKVTKIDSLVNAVSWQKEDAEESSRVIVREYAKDTLVRETIYEKVRRISKSAGDSVKVEKVASDSVAAKIEVVKNDSIAENSHTKAERGSDRFVWFNLIEAMVCLLCAAGVGIYIYFKKR